LSISPGAQGHDWIIRLSFIQPMPHAPISVLALDTVGQTVVQAHRFGTQGLDTKLLCPKTWQRRNVQYWTGHWSCRARTLPQCDITNIIVLSDRFNLAKNCAWWRGVLRFRGRLRAVELASQLLLDRPANKLSQGPRTARSHCRMKHGCLASHLLPDSDNSRQYEVERWPLLSRLGTRARWAGPSR